MSEQIVAAVVGGISGAIVSGVVYWFLEKNKENKIYKKYKQQHKDVFLFLNNLSSFQKSTNTMEDFLQKLGSYRANRISPILEKSNILKVNLLGNGDFDLSLKSCFHSYTEKNINEIIKDIKNGLYDEYLD